MATRKKKEDCKVVAAAAMHIDPARCDSIIQYKIIKGSYSYATVQLADCNRKIEWYFANKPSSVTKIDTVIKALQDFREAFVASRKPVRRAKKKVENGE